MKTTSFFLYCRPYNFGSIGGIIGHELTHTFDESGRMHDEDGNLWDWWEPETFTEFSKKSDCLVKQYSNYTYDGTPVSSLGFQQGCLHFKVLFYS